MSYHGPRENGEGRVSEGGHDRARDPTITNIPNVSIPTPLRLAWGLSTPNTAAEPEVTTTGSPSILDLSLTTRTPYFRCIYGTISSHTSTAYYSSRHTWSTTWYWEGFHGIRTGYYWCTSSRTATFGQNTKSSWSLHIIFPEHLSVRDSPSLEIAGTPLLMTYEYLEAFYQDSHFVKKSFSDRSDAWIEISWVVTVDFQWFPDFFFQSYIIRLLGSNLWRLFRCSEFDVRWKTNFKIFSNSTRFPNKWKRLWMASAMIAHSHSDWLSHLCKCWTNVFRNSDLQEKKTRLHRHVHESVHYGPNATLFIHPLQYQQFKLSLQLLHLHLHLQLWLPHQIGTKAFHPS